MIKVKKHGILLYPTELNFENQSVANPACIEANSENKFETNDKPYPQSNRRPTLSLIELTQIKE